MGPWHTQRGVVALAIGWGLVVGTHASAARAATAVCVAQACVPMVARVRIAGSREPVPEARVYLFPAPSNERPRTLTRPLTPDPSAAWTRTGTTDARGDAYLDNVPTGPAFVVVVAPGVGRLDQVVAIERAATLKLFVTPDDATLYRTTVRLERSEPGHVSTSVLSTDEIQTLPGSQGDPLRALQNLPGVARSPGHLGLLVLRGAPPSQSRVFVGGHAIPQAFHLLSMSSVFPTDILDGLRLVPGNFDVAWGNATGGIVQIDLRDGRRAGVHGHAEVDIGSASASLEGPVGPGSFLIAGSRGYIDAVLGAADRVIERVTEQPNSFILPAYYDYQGLLRLPLRRGGVIAVRAFGSGDRLHNDRDRDREMTSGFDFHSTFHRVDFDYRVARTRHWAWLTPSFRFEQNGYRYDFGNLGGEQRRRDFIVSFRGELGTHLTRRIDVTAGTDGEIDAYRVLFRDALVTPETSRGTRRRGVETTLAAWARLEARWRRLHLTGGVRSNIFVVDGRPAFSIDPRVSARVFVHERWRLHFGVGRYSQVRTAYTYQEFGLAQSGLGLDLRDQLPAVFASFNPRLDFAPVGMELGVRQAWHASAGVHGELGAGVSLETTAFWRRQDEATPVLDANTNTVTGARHTDTVGAEVLIRKALTRRLYGWIAYTLMWSRIRIVDSPVRFPFYPSDFDQRHHLVVLASYRLPRGFQLGASWRFSTGYPYTPIIGALQTDYGLFPLYGAYNSARLGLYHQLNVRVDKQWITKRAKVRVYFDVQNVYNRMNPEWVRYRPDFRGVDHVLGLPIFPTLGIRVDW